MPRAATTSDVFNAIAEPRRREIIDLLVNGREHAVGDLVLRLRMPQPAYRSTWACSGRSGWYRRANAGSFVCTG